VAGEPTSFGLLDRDFATDEQVITSRDPTSRVAIMRRYAIENYLLEPTIIAEAVRQLLTTADAGQLRPWLDEAYTRAMFRRWADELALYAAANSIIAEWRDRIMFDRSLGFLCYFGPLPPISRAEVVSSLQRRLAALTAADRVEAVLDTRHAQVVADVAHWDGLQQWIHGKVLLESYLYPHVFEPAGCSQSRARDLLIEVGRKHVPDELQELVAAWMV
jgi:hypothetical protein